MEWLSENWLLVLFGGGMIAMHFGGHRHGGKGGGGEKSKQTDAVTEKIPQLPPSS